MLFRRLDIVNLRLWPMKLCTTASGEDILLSNNPEYTGTTLSIASNLATTGSSQEVTHGLNMKYHHTPTRLPLSRSLFT